MGVDIAVTFPKVRVHTRRLLTLVCREVWRMSPNSETYILLTDRGRPLGVSIWSTDDWTKEEGINLTELGEVLAGEIGPVCTAWKSDHGGCAGYVIHRPGRPFKFDDVMAPVAYDAWLTHKVEEVFGLGLGLTEEGDEFFFPELFFGQDRGYRVEQGELRKLTPEEALAVFEERTPAEPMFPV